MNCQLCIVILFIRVSMAVKNSAEDEYEYEFTTIDYIKEAPNSTMLKEPIDYLCRLPDAKRREICKEMSQLEFAVKSKIKYMEDGPLGEEKMYELKINSGIYVADCPLIVSACSCPTIPPLYLRNKHYGVDVLAYVELPPVEMNNTIRDSQEFHENFKGLD